MLASFSTRAAVLILTALLLHADPASAQEDSVTIAAGERYAAGSLHRWVLGSGYRDLWTLPIRVPVLLPDTFSGGLTPSEIGGGAQTISLRFLDPQGREWTFRSVDKDQSGGLHPDLRGTLVSRIAQDQVSSKHPASALVVAPILDAVGVLHVDPRLAVMADAPSLGEFREQFAGMLGMMEERPDEAAEAGPFSVYERVIGTDRLFERVLEDRDDRPDAEAYLRARLVDLMLGDWDRHPDQWRWAQVDSAGVRLWQPIPRDRDNAFSSVNGLMGIVGGALRSNVFAYTPEYPDLYGMMHNAQALDRLILPEVGWTRWMAIAEDVQSRVTDAVLRDATMQMPPPYAQQQADQLFATLQTRRDALLDAAAEFYRLNAMAPDLQGTDLDDVVHVRRIEDGGVEVAFMDGYEPYRTALFEPEWTREVRVYLEDGDDRATVSGDGPARIQVRIIGGEGDDRLIDETNGHRVFFFDGEGDDQFETADATHIDPSDFEFETTESFVENNAPAPRDWGSDMSLFSPTAMWISEEGPAVGGGATWTRYGFRRIPYATQTRLTALYAPLQTRFAVEGEYSRIWTGNRGETSITGEATQLRIDHFYGYGNETIEAEDDEPFDVWSNRVRGRLDLHRRFGPSIDVYAGASGSYTSPDVPDDLPAELRTTPGLDSYSLGGLHLGSELDFRDSATLPTSGARLQAEASGYPLTGGDAYERFGTARAVATGYLPVPLPLETVVALRAGGEHLWGDAPLQYAPRLGGSETLRGHHTGRFFGDSSAFGSAELRVRLFKANLWIARSEVGVIGLYDAGRVWLDGEDSDQWHTAQGGGLWFATIDRKLTAHVVYAHGERSSLSASLGMPF